MCPTVGHVGHHGASEGECFGAAGVLVGGGHTIFGATIGERFKRIAMHHAIERRGVHRAIHGAVFKQGGIVLLTDGPEVGARFGYHARRQTEFHSHAGIVFLEGFYITWSGFAHAIRDGVA